MPYSFAIRGHENILSTHPRTIEFTKDSELTKNGDCILGVSAGFSLQQLQRFLSCGKIGITITAAGIAETITAIPNKKFSDNHEMVVRMGDFDSERTFATRADKAAVHLDRGLVAALRRGGKGSVTISGV